MRFNLVSQPSATIYGNNGPIPLSLTLHPAFGGEGEYIYATDSSGLRRLLEAGTDLPSTVIQSFMGSVAACENALLPGVDLSRNVLRVIGYNSPLD